MEELQDFKLDDLYDKLRLEEDEFQEWLSEIGLLHASRTCACGNPMRKTETDVEFSIGDVFVPFIDQLHQQSASKLALSSKMQTST